MSNATHVTAYLCAQDAAAALAFYKQAFAATERYRMTGDDGRVGRAEFTIGETALFLSDEYPEMAVVSPKTLGGSPVAFVLEVADLDATWQRALDAVAIVTRPIAEAPFGRGGWLVDPFGHRWNLMTSNPGFKPEELTSSDEGEWTTSKGG
jgi:PhnB protein